MAILSRSDFRFKEVRFDVLLKAVEFKSHAANCVFLVFRVLPCVIIPRPGFGAGVRLQNPYIVFTGILHWSIVRDGVLGNCSTQP